MNYEVYKKVQSMAGSLKKKVHVCVSFEKYFRKNPKYLRPPNLLMCADSITLLTQPLCTVGWFAKTEIYILVAQRICLVHKKKNCNLWTNIVILKSFRI